MAFFERDEKTRIRYATGGNPDGAPILLIAPGGMRSSMAHWSRIGWDPRQVLSDRRWVAMDQRNAGESVAPVTANDGWHTYTEDQLALMDHLEIERFDVLGMCIGGPYIMGLIQHAPERVVSAVMLQPIGLDDNRAAFYEMFDAWASDIAAEHPEASTETWASFRSNLYDGDFLFNTNRATAAACQHPVFLAMGDDRYHPQSISRELAELLPNATFVEAWKRPELMEQTTTRIRDFLSEHGLSA